MQIRISGKHLQIDKAQSRIMATIAITTIITVFCLFSAKALLSQAAYQRRVIKAQSDAAAQLEKNTKTAGTLVNQYENVFQGDNATNIIGGKNTKQAEALPPDGDNARIVLDALPTTYDYPALLTSMSSLVLSNGFSSPTIAGTDDSSTSDNRPQPNPQPNTMSLNIQGTASYANIQKFISDLERSIRPFDVNKLTLSGNEGNMTASFSVNTYYQQAKALTIGQKEIK